MFEDKIKEIFCDAYKYSEDKKRGTVYFYTESGVSFAKLLELSKVLGTIKIDFNTYKASGCSTCGPDEYYEVSAYEVDFE
jgi:hypothetical protein